MTLNKRFASHRILKRQTLNVPNGPQSSSRGSTGASSSSSSISQSPGGGSSAPSSTSTPQPNIPSSTSSPPTKAVHTSTIQSSVSSVTPSTTSSSTSSSSDSTSSSTSTSSTTSSSSLGSSSVKKSSSVSTSISVPVFATTTVPTVTQPSLGMPNPLSSNTTTSTAGPTGITASSGISTGAIVGSVAGALGGLVMLAIIIAFLLRRWRRRGEGSDLDFNPDELVSPTTEHTGGFGGGPTNRVSTFDPSPPNMAQLRGHSATPSMNSPGMAGHGAYPFIAGVGNNTLHERPNYTYGTAYDLAVNDDSIAGPYSSQPQLQSAYNPEAYASYVPPPVLDNHDGRQQVFQPYQAQSQAYAYGDAGAPPPLVPGAHAVLANRSTKSMDNEEAYGGY